MIKIEKPRIEFCATDNQKGAFMRGVRLVSHVVNEVIPLKEDLWFETETEYGRYFCDEVCDAFVVAMLLPAVQTHQDIECDCISEKLLYNLNHIVTFLLQNAWKGRRIEIRAKRVVNTGFNGKSVGTGCSLGIDSFAAIFSQTREYCTPSYCITHLTNFNVGAFGSKDIKLARESWLHDLEKIKLFVEEYNLPLVTLDSNIGIINYDTVFDEVFILRNAAAILSLQKLFGRYFIASGRTVDTIKINKDDISYYETLLSPLLSTEGCDIIISEADKTRVEKTKFIADNPLVKKHLYVCWKEIFKNEWPHYWEDIKDYADKYRNCTRCNKCMRTCLTLELLGCLDDYKDVFDIPQYYKTRTKYIKRVLTHRNSDSLMKEIYILMQEKNFPIPLKAKIGAYSIRLRAVLKGKCKMIMKFFQR